MKKLTEKQYEDLVKDRHGAQNLVITEILKLEVGESIFIATDDWKKKTPLNMMLGQYRARHNKKLTTATVESGWVVKRLE